MSDTEVSAGDVASEVEPYLLDAQAVVASLGSDAAVGLDDEEAARRLGTAGPNQITGDRAPSVWAVAASQLRDPMNIMLVVVSVASFLIAQLATGLLVAVLVVLNVVLGTGQDLKARASVDALAKLQVPRSRVLRDGRTDVIEASGIVPGDIVQLEAGELVPADGRVLRSATLEVQEAALTGESAPVSKDAGVLEGPEVALGDRSNMLFQNTSVTRGTATMVVTATGMQTEMGRIATMLASVNRTPSPLQRELNGLTRVIGIFAWAAVAVIVIVGFARGISVEDVLLLGVAMAISAIPTGLPTFVQALLSRGAKQLADARAIVKNLADVETLGATSAINSDKTGTLTLNEMMVSVIYSDGAWFEVEGTGYAKAGAIRSAAGVAVPDFTRLAYGMSLCSDALVGDDGTVVGDPTEAALVVLSAKLGVDAAETRRVYPRLAEIPFDSDYKFMATFHRIRLDGEERLVELVKGGPDVVLARCATAQASGALVPVAEVRDELLAANERMGGRGLRVLAFAVRVLEPGDEATIASDPMALADGLAFAGMVGIIDPLRPEAKDAVAVALAAGIDVRMITGDHAVTARAIGEDLGLGPGAVSGAELARMSDEELTARLPELHVFGRVTPEDKLRLARVMQRSGLVVAMTGDAVNDAAGLKQADIGVAMGSGSEVTKQAARMILTDDNFGTLVHAVQLGRGIYSTIVAYVRFQMTQLISLVLLFLTATIFNINQGVALTPLMVLFLNFFVCIPPVAAIAFDPGDPDIMRRPPRDPKVTITNPGAVLRWILFGAIMFVSALIPLVAGPDPVGIGTPSASMTMSFVVLGFSTILSALVFRRDPGSGLVAPILSALKLLSIPAILVVLATELGFLQRALLTQSLTGIEWLESIGLALLLPIVVEAEKWLRRRRAARHGGRDG
ncbi:cation-translocating P-type ATPase [Protaetiibacter larvae]|uniref:Cation-transporting P-type ATPase n=1 Tax=Protaetiibacter larvae TaxID=2592654 RepID=A0A5C1Y6R9_9MICO|nr:cation-transporting P-type ATPase [Protaetiibacter larvae]QEO09753.1 cation-transporting P-type ATPase [Protaetiibacter larvae]